MSAYPCPVCGKPCEADFVDNGVGMERVGPYRCNDCKWVEPSIEFDAMTDFNAIR